MTILEKIIHQLQGSGIESPRLEARLLIAHILQCDATQIMGDVILTEEQNEYLQTLLARRLKHEPLDKIIGHREFYKSDFKVSNKVLSPRADTETLVEEALLLIDSVQSTNILDLGTGSGCIIESLLSERPNCCGTAVDISSEALQIARENAENLGLDKRLKFIQADWFADDFSEKINDTFDVIVTNPPYIPSNDIASLMPEVREYDPLLALDGGNDGFLSYKRIAELVPQMLKNGGYILIEAGIEQAAQIADIFSEQGLQHIKTANDLAGVPRCVVMKK